jgi:hypothetical protein
LNTEREGGSEREGAEREREGEGGSRDRHVERERDRGEREGQIESKTGENQRLIKYLPAFSKKFISS